MKKILCLALSILALAACHKESPSYIVQVSLGSWDHADYTAAQVISRIDTVNSIIPVGKVIIGWTADKAIYREVGDYLHSKGIKMLLWLPVFAETEGVCDNSPAVDLWGRTPANYDLTAGEGFRFNCPSDPRNVANVVGLYDRLFSDCGFDGVFLDRIRSQSFVGGVSGVLSCGCPICRERYAAEGVDLDAVRAAYDAAGDSFFEVTADSAGDSFFDVTADSAGDSFFDVTADSAGDASPAVTAYERGFRLSNPIAADFFRAKGKIVSGSVAAVADSLRGRGLEIGLDLYAPFMAPFVGQDYEILSEHAAFIKPMLYRKTFAPAGMGFEYDLLRKAVPGASGYPVIEMSADFLDSQLDAMAPYPCEKYPGIEINYREGIVPTSPEYVRESLEHVMAHHFQGGVLSWNIMEAPDSHIAALK